MHLYEALINGASFYKRKMDNDNYNNLRYLGGEIEVHL